MKTYDQVSAAKLRGGFYSPIELVQHCLDRVDQLIPQSCRPVKILEPSAGDGAFIRGLQNHGLADRVTHVTAVEPVGAEAAKCSESLENSTLQGVVVPESLFDCIDDLPLYDAAVGNPPFVRFQFIDGSDRARAEFVLGRLGIPLAGVSNLWIPVLLATLSQVREGGAFAFIVPAECFTGISARIVRNWLISHSTKLAIDLFPARSFPEVIQEVVVVSGCRVNSRAQRASVEVHDHAANRAWQHEVSTSAHTWTGYLLTPPQLEALSVVTSLENVYSFGSLAKLSVATVTGANEFFSVDDVTKNNYDLNRWCIPLLARIRHATGLRYSDADFKESANLGLPRWLLDTSVSPIEPRRDSGITQYLREGEFDQLHLRYKCRIRTPWHRVPVVKPGRLLLSKRSHRFPRLVLNEVDAVTTDTIYQGNLSPVWKSREEDLIAGFHNSMTLLSAEIEGRSFGGGVLELVPSEVARLLVPLAPIGAHLDRLDQLVRAHGTDNETLVDATDELLAKSSPGLDSTLLDTLRDARQSLLSRRLGRN